MIGASDNQFEEMISYRRDINNLRRFFPPGISGHETNQRLMDTGLGIIQSDS